VNHKLAQIKYTAGYCEKIELARHSSLLSPSLSVSPLSLSHSLLSHCAVQRKPTSQPTNQPETNHFTNQPTNQPTQPTQPTNQSNHQPGSTNKQIKLQSNSRGQRQARLKQTNTNKQTKQTNKQ
jgi:hypothetical protein